MVPAAVIRELGAAAEPGEVEEPEAGSGEVIVELEAAALNPVDVAIASGNFYAGHPPLPYVPGIEAVGTVDGRRVYVLGGGLGIARNGTGRVRFAAPEERAIDLPEDADPGVAAALGTAGLAGWLPMSWRAAVQPGETVLVLGATGFAGGVAVAAARHLGAGRIVAAGRNRDRLAALEDLADAVVPLDTEDLPAALAAAVGDGGADVVYDPLWGAPFEAALSAVALRGRVVCLGASAGPTAHVASAAVRGKQLDLLGYSNFGVPADVSRSAYLEMVRLATAGDLRVEVERVPIAEAARAWEGLVAGSTKYVLVP